MPPAVDGPLGQFEMGRDRRGDRSGVYVGVREEVVDVVVAVDLRVELARRFRAIAREIADGGEVEVVVEVEVRAEFGPR